MTAHDTEPQADTEVIELRAADAGTEAHLAEAPGPAYVTLGDGEAQRRAIIPAHWRTREAAMRHLQLRAARHGHAAAYHGVRVPRYLGLTVRTDLSKARQAPWPLLRGGQADVFAGFPFGTDPRGRTVKAPMAYHNWLVGSIPRQGKTATVRVLTCAAALDPIAERWIHELKGSGDLDPLEKVCHRFCSGVDDESIAYAAESLKLLRAEIARRTERIKALDRAPRGTSPGAGRSSCGRSCARSTRHRTCFPTRSTARPRASMRSSSSRSGPRSASS